MVGRTNEYYPRQVTKKADKIFNFLGRLYQGIVLYAFISTTSHIHN